MASWHYLTSGGGRRKCLRWSAMRRQQGAPGKMARRRGSWGGGPGFAAFGSPERLVVIAARHRSRAIGRAIRRAVGRTVERAAGIAEAIRGAGRAVADLAGAL